MNEANWYEDAPPARSGVKPWIAGLLLVAGLGGGFGIGRATAGSGSSAKPAESGVTGGGADQGPGGGGSTGP